MKHNLNFEPNEILGYVLCKHFPEVRLQKEEVDE